MTFLKSFLLLLDLFTTTIITMPGGYELTDMDVLIIIIIIIITIIITRPKPAYGRQGLDWIVGPGYSFVVFSTNKTMETNQKP